MDTEIYRKYDQCIANCLHYAIEYRLYERVLTDIDPKNPSHLFCLHILMMSNYYTDGIEECKPTFVSLPFLTYLCLIWGRSRKQYYLKRLKEEECPRQLTLDVEDLTGIFEDRFCQESDVSLAQIWNEYYAPKRKV